MLRNEPVIISNPPPRNSLVVFLANLSLPAPISIPLETYFHAIFVVNFSLMSVYATPTCSHQSFDGSSYYVDVETIELFPLPIYPYLLLFQFPPRNVRIIVDLFPLPIYPCLFLSQSPLETLET